MSFAALEPAEFAKAFPYFLLADGSLTITQAGQSLESCLGALAGRGLLDAFQLVRPELRAPTAADLAARVKSPFVLDAGELRLRGQLLLKEGGGLLFLLWPWVKSLEEARGLGLSLSDLPSHTMIADFLLLLQTQRTNLGDLERLTQDLAIKQAELTQALQLAEAATRARDNFLASVSHEIRTPLNAILGLGELLKQGVREGRLKTYASTLVSASEHLYALVDDLLDVAQIERGELVLRPRTFELREVVQQTVQLVEATARAKGLTLDLELADELPLWVSGEPQRLRQVLVNLLNNAVKYTARGGVTLTVQPASGDEIRFVVRDTGIGIALEDQARIFERFTRLQVEPSAGGVGLGLTISKALVNLLDGSLTLESAPGQGSTFSLTLPLPAQEARIPTGQYDLSGTGLRVLVAEDNPDNQLVLREFLRTSPHELEFAEDGLAALERFRRDRYDLVLMDLQMPRMDGYEAAAAIREFEREEGRPPTPMISLSAHAYPQFIERARAAGCDEHMVKPIRQDELLLLLERYAASKSSQRLQALDAGPSSPGEAAPSAPANGPAVDLAQVPAPLRPLVGKYVANQVEQLEAMRTARETGDLEQLAKLAHKLKGTGASYGFTPLTTWAGELEQAARDRQETSRLAELLTAIAGYLQEAQAQLATQTHGGHAPLT